MELSLIKQEVNRQLADPSVVQTLLTTTFKGLSVDNMKAAIVEGHIRGFNFKDFLEKNVYAIKYGQGYSLVTSIDHARKIGMRSGVCGTLPPTYTEKEGKIETCTVTVQRVVNGVVGNFSALVYFDEYYKAGKTWEGKYTPSMWDTKPRTMIAKVAEMHALRKACPEELSQAYVEEEGAPHTDVIEVVPITLESCTAQLEGAKTPEELRNAWAKVPLGMQKDLAALKDTLKAKLEPK